MARSVYKSADFQFGSFFSIVWLTKQMFVLLMVLFPSNSWAYHQFNGLTSGHSFVHASQKLDYPIGFEGPDAWNIYSPNAKPQSVRVSSCAELREKISQGYKVSDLDVRGDTKVIGSNHRTHPVIQAVHRRLKDKSLPGKRTDNMKIGLAIEGGGMRGCVAAGMATALWALGLSNAFDVVYGSSAGSLIGAYFVSEQMPYVGPSIYYNSIPRSSSEFVDKSSYLRSVGLGFLDVRPSRIKSLFHDRLGKPILDLDYLLSNIVKTRNKFDWDKFEAKQTRNEQILKVVASGVLSKEAVAFSYTDGNFRSLDELNVCLKASMLIPGVTGDFVRLKGDGMQSSNCNSNCNIQRTWWRDFINRNEYEYVYGSEPYCDALVYEPVPYRSALREQCTHVLVLRTRPDNVSVTKPLSLSEKMILSRFFAQKMGLPNVANWMINQHHKLIYAEDILRLNEANKYQSLPHSEPQQGDDADILSKLFAIALPSGAMEVDRLDTKQEIVLQSMRAGFATAYNLLCDSESDEGKGEQEAKRIWPDSVLSKV